MEGHTSLEPLEPADQQSEPSTTAPIIRFIASRMVINGTYLMIYPFLKVFAAGMDVSIQTAALPLAVRSLAGVLGPLLAPVAD